MNTVFDFGLESAFPRSEVTDNGKILSSSEVELVTRPYLVLFDESKSQPAQLDHFLSKPFPGHSWNHYLLYWLQDYPIELVRSFACFLLSGRRQLPQTQLLDADADSILFLAQKLKEFEPFYESLLGARCPDFLADCRKLFARRRILGEIRAQEEPARPCGKNLAQAATPLDETYLHLSFMQSAFLAHIDACLLDYLGMDKNHIIDNRLYDNPIYKRLCGKAPQTVMKFLAAWHRQSYRLPPFAKRFIRSFRRITLRKA